MTSETNVEEDTYELKIDEPISEDLFEPIPDTDIYNPRVIGPWGENLDIPKTSDRGYNTTWDQRNKYKEIAERLGYDSGCVVVRRSETMYMRVNPDRWGIVTNVVTWENYPNKYFAPIKARWLDGTEGFYYPDELIIVSFRPDDIDMGMIRRGEI